MKSTAVHNSISEASQYGMAHSGSKGKENFFSKSGSEQSFFPQVQTKLTIGEPGDKYEVDADAMADKVVQRLHHPETEIGTPFFQGYNGNAALQTKCEACEGDEEINKKEEEQEGEDFLQSKTFLRLCESSDEELQRKCSECEEEIQPKLNIVNCKNNTGLKRMPREKMPIAQKKETYYQPFFSSTNVGVSIQTKCKECEAKEDVNHEDDEQHNCSECEKDIQNQIQKNGNEASADSDLELQLNNTKGRGSSLPDRTRTRMEHAFGADFSDVRIHTGSSAVEMSRELNAQAFTHGSDIYFNTGKYNTGTKGGQHLLAHELTHTVQQGSSAQRSIQRIELPGFVEDGIDVIGDGIDTAADVTSDAYDTTVDTVSEGLYTVGEELGINDEVLGAYETVSDTIDAATDWLMTTAGRAARGLAAALGGVITVTRSGITITFPRICPVDALTFDIDIDPVEKESMAPIFGIPIGPGILTGEVGLTATIDPFMELQVGPFCLEGASISINPLSGSYSVRGGVSATAGASLGAEARAGLRGQLGYNGIVVIGGVPVPIEIPVIGVEGGIAGMARGIGVGKFIIGGGLGYSGGSLTAGGFTQLNMGVAADLFLGAYAQMDVWGENFCRLYWEPLLWHGDIAGFFNIMAGVSIGPGPSAMVISTASLGTLPFNQFDLALSREGFSDDCPIKDKVCQLMGNLGLFPSQNGGVWSETGPWGPGARLLGPHQVYQRFPGGGRTAKCRGACGVDCDTCKHHPVHKITDPATGEVWEYTDFEDCNSNTGCREHDAAFDWAQVTKGESGKWAMIMPWHMAANIECGCNTVALNCPAWALGLPPYDKKIFFATTATKITTPGPGPGPVPGPGPEPGGVPSGNEELDLERCDRNELPPEFCEELYNRVIERYGNRDRDLDFDPDAELDGHRFPEDAPILDRFRAIYNRLDSWNVYIATNHTEWFGEFTTEFGVERKRTEWMNAIKEETKEFKKRFRDIGNADPEGERRRFERETLEKYEQKIDDLVHEIAVWYKNKTGSTESIEEIIERIHREGTELWRAAWRAAILEINRILSRIWPPAKAGLESWIGGERSRHPGIDLSGSISEIDYIGSLAKGYKSPSKQFVRFNPDNFDVDAFLLAPPLSKWALNFASGRHDPDFIDKGRIWGRASAISLLISFADLAHREFSSVQGYDTSEIFDVVLRTPGTPQQDRHRLGSDRLYALRESLSYERYQQLLSDLRDANLMETDPEGRLLLRDNLSATEDEQLNEILNRYET